MAKRRGIFARIRNAIQRVNRATTRTTRTSSSGGGGSGGGGDFEEQPIEIETPENIDDEVLDYPEDYGQDIEVPVYEVDEETTVVERIHIPGPDPMKLRSGDLLATAAFYGVTDDEYEALEAAINTAYNDPNASSREREQALRDIQDAMSIIHARSRAQDGFDWAKWREEVYGGKR